MRTPSWRGPLTALVLVHVAVLGAGVLAPYAPDEQAREFASAPPTPLRWIDAEGRFHPRPFVLALVPVDAPGPPRYREDWNHRVPLDWLVRPDGPGSGLRLFSVAGPQRVMLFGADAFGRDQFSRFVHGGRLSLLAGLLATTVAVGLGVLIGLTAGAGGHIADRSLMFMADLVSTVPWIYLLVAVRAALPLTMPAATSWLAIVGIVGALGWVRPARMVRAVVASARTADFVLAARASGAGPLRVWTRHLLPSVWPVAATQAALLMPQCVLAEVTLSFLGLGIGEPTPSWGGLLSPLQQLASVQQTWWLLLPLLALVPVFLLYYALARALVHRAA